MRDHAQFTVRFTI